MNKNTLTAFVLMALVVFGFMAWENYQRPKQEEEMRILDSIAQVENAKELAKQKEKIAKEEAEAKDSLNPLFEVRTGKESATVIENELLKVTLTNKGGQLKKVELKDSEYKSQNGGNVILFDENDQSMNIMLDGKSANIATADLFFTAQDVKADGVTMHLPVSNGSLDISYTLKPNSYVLDMTVKANGLAGFFPSKTNSMQIDWTENMKQQEKGYDFETRYSTITYRDTDGDTHELNTNGGDDEEDEFEESTKWIAYKTQFFSQVLVADKPMKISNMSSVALEKGTKEDLMAGKAYLKTYKTSFAASFDAKGEEATKFHMYLGPNDFQTLAKNEEFIAKDADLDLQSLVYLGWPVVKWINRFVFLYAFDFLTGLGLPMGIVLVILTIIVKVIVFPLMKKSYLSSANMRVLRPKMDEINAKYSKPEDAMLKQQEVMKLYSEYGVSPMGGCLPMVIQMPIWIALFNFIPNYIAMRGESFLWADDLSTYDDLISWGVNIWGIGDHLSIFCVLWCLSTVVSSYISQKQQSYSMTPEQQQQMGMMKWMMYLMPLIFFFSFNSYSAGLNWYYFISGLTSVLIMWFLRKTTDDAKLLAKLEKRHAERKQNAAGKKKTSSMMERLQAMQQKQMDILRQQQESRQNNQ
ncbi:MAG: membrane protein insertase YidC [Prevotellaceae bacterium]|nr:membrane protein insertase YidC [Candidatus Minthosoma equi]